MDGFELTLDLPYPPSMNHYWRRVGSRTLVSRRGREFQAEVCWAASEQYSLPQPLSGPLSIKVDVQAPDRRRRDLDNLLKPLLDALTHAAVWEDDSQVHRIEIAWVGEPAKPGSATVRIAKHETNA